MTRPTLVTDEVVERVAAAMRKAPALGPTVRGYPTGEIVDYDMLARAAIAAMPAIPPQSLDDHALPPSDDDDGVAELRAALEALKAKIVRGIIAETPTPGPAIDQDGGWQPIETAPHAMHFLVSYFYEEGGEWIYDIASWHGDHVCGVADGSGPWKYWRPLPEPPTPKQGNTQ